MESYTHSSLLEDFGVNASPCGSCESREAGSVSISRGMQAHSLTPEDYQVSPLFFRHVPRLRRLMSEGVFVLALWLLGHWQEGACLSTAALHIQQRCATERDEWFKDQ